MYMNPYYNAFNPYATAQHNAPTLQQQQIIQVNGKASVDTIQLAPNSSVLLMDTTAPIVWMCVSDGVGKVSSTPYDIKVHEEKPPVDVASFEERITKVEKIISEMEEKLNAKQSYADSAKPKQDYAKYRQDQTAHAER